MPRAQRHWPMLTAICFLTAVMLHGPAMAADSTPVRMDIMRPLDAATAPEASPVTPAPAPQPAATPMPAPVKGLAAAPGLPEGMTTGTGSAVANPTEAEQVTRLQRSVEADRQRLNKLRIEMADPRGEYAWADAEFKQIDDDVQTKKLELEKAKEAGNEAQVAKLTTALSDLDKKWRLARERFDLAIQTRKTLQEQVAALEQKIQSDQKALDKLTGAVQSPAATLPSPAGPATPAATLNVVTPGSPAAAPVTTTATMSAATSATAPTAEPAPPSTTAAAITPVPTAAADPAAPATAVDTPSETIEKPASKELVQAQQVAETKKQEAAAAEEEVRSIEERIASLGKNIALEQKLFEGTRKKADNAFESFQILEDEHRRKAGEGAPPAELKELAKKAREAEARFKEARSEVRERTDRLQELQAELGSVQAEKIAALNDAQALQGEADKAEADVQRLQNPFSVHNVLQWALDHGPRLLVIVLALFTLNTVVRLSSRRIVRIMSQSGARGSREEREDRARTLVGVFQNAMSLALVSGGMLMVCEEVGIAIAPLMGGAAVVGLAVAFGAQNLIRDYFYGFVILLENQYKINDVLKIGDTSGQVERITLRMTVLRDLEGRVHFVPNGKIDSVTNMTHGWSRAVFEIGVAYKEDADRVMNVLMELARELRADPQYKLLILDEPEMLGVDSFGDSAVNIKFLIKTRPLKQWQIKRELLRRIKRRFDELNIEIPFPHRTVYHHNMTSPAAASEEIAPDWSAERAA